MTGIKSTSAYSPVDQIPTSPKGQTCGQELPSLFRRVVPYPLLFTRVPIFAPLSVRGESQNPETIETACDLSPAFRSI